MTKGNSNLKKAARELAEERGIKYTEALRILSDPKRSIRHEVRRRIIGLFDGSLEDTGDPQDCMFSIERRDGMEERYVFDMEAMAFLPSMKLKDGSLFIFAWISGEGFTISVEGRDFRFDRIDYMEYDEVRVKQLGLEEASALHDLYLFTNKERIVPNDPDMSDDDFAFIIADSLVNRSEKVGTGRIGFGI